MTLMSPKPYATVSGFTRETDTGFQQTLPQTKSSRFGLNEEKSQFGDLRFARPYAKDRSKSLAAVRGYPASFTRRVMAVREGNQDFGDQKFERPVESVMFGVEFAMPLYQPADIANLKVAKDYVIRLVAHISSDAAALAASRPLLAKRSAAG